jgi:hypothetical protein
MMPFEFQVGNLTWLGTEYHRLNHRMEQQYCIPHPSQDYVKCSDLITIQINYLFQTQKKCIITIYIQ